MKHIDELTETIDEYEQEENDASLHPSEIAYLLIKLRKKDKEKYFEYLDKIPQDQQGAVILELPQKRRVEVIEYYSSEKLAGTMQELESDDATDLLHAINDIDETKADEVVEKLDTKERQDIDKLRFYEENQAGAWMQTELFNAALDETISDSIERFKKRKEEGELENVSHVYLVNENNILVAKIRLEDIFMYGFDTYYKDILGKLNVDEFKSVEASTDIEEVATLFEQYDLSSIPVVDFQGKLIGRITSDDIYDIIEERATRQIYQQAGVDEEVEKDDKIAVVAYKRGTWLGVNLVVAILASMVIGMFEETLAAFIPLAILMPIVASMGGNAGLQALTVMIRRIALGEVEYENAKEAIVRELTIVLINGSTFAVIVGIVAYVWFGVPLLGVVIASAMIINLMIAGFLGSIVPLTMKRLDIDPAVGSTVVLTMTTDMLGFFCFLGLAELILV